MFVYSYVNAWTCEATPVSHEAAAHKAINLLGVPPSKRAPKKRRYWSSTKESGVTMILQMCVELVTDKCLRRGDSVLSLAVVVRGQARAVFTVEGCDRQQGAFCMWGSWRRCCLLTPIGDPLSPWRSQFRPCRSPSPLTTLPESFCTVSWLACV